MLPLKYSEIYSKGKANSSGHDFFESSFTFSNQSIEVSCCNVDMVVTNVTCGNGTSCVGACSAIEASLCPSGNCTGDPDDCRPNLSTEDGSSNSNPGPALATRPPWEFKWCLPSCPVLHHTACCFHPTCYSRKPVDCDWMNYFTGICFSPKKIVILKKDVNFRKAHEDLFLFSPLPSA